MSDVSSQKRDFGVSAQQAEASEILREIVGPFAPGAGMVKAAIRRASVLTGMPFGRTRSIWYREARVWAEEIDHLRAKQNELRGRQHCALERVRKLECELEILRAQLEGAKVAHKGGKVDP